MAIIISPSDNDRDLQFKFSKTITKQKYNKDMEIPEIFDNAKNSNFQNVIKMKFNFKSIN